MGRDGDRLLRAQGVGDRGNSAGHRHVQPRDMGRWKLRPEGPQKMATVTLMTDVSAGETKAQVMQQARLMRPILWLRTVCEVR